MRLGLLTGLRSGELLSSRWSQIDLQTATWRVTGTKSGHDHTVYLSAYAVELLDQCPWRGLSPWIFPSTQGDGHYRSLAKAFKHLKNSESSASAFRMHDTRRTFATYLLREGFDSLVIAKCLNHTVASVTGRYAVPMEDQRREAAEAMGRLVRSWSAGE